MTILGDVVQDAPILWGLTSGSRANTITDMAIDRRGYGSWPIDRASLGALLDMGLTVVQIARYFSIDPIEVLALLDRH